MIGKFFRKNGMSKHPLSQRRRAFTIAEMVISVGILGFVGASTSYLMLTSALTAKELYGTTDSRSQRMIALNQIRYRLCDGQIGSVNKKNGDGTTFDGNTYGGRLITYIDPTLAGSPVCTFRFLPSTKELQFRVGTGAFETVAKGPIDVTFFPGALPTPTSAVRIGNDALVTIFVQTSSDLRYGQVDVRDGETVIYLRNPAVVGS
jgi:type II secretory pathway pseudopilin PulG